MTLDGLRKKMDSDWIRGTKVCYPVHQKLSGRSEKVTSPFLPVVYHLL